MPRTIMNRSDFHARAPNPERVEGGDLAGLLEGTPYRAVAHLSSGGMGDIYVARAPDEQRVAVKLLRADLVQKPGTADRMRVVGEALDLLRHPNIVTSYGHGTTSGGRPYVAMELLEGTTLQSELKRRGALPT